MSDSLFASDWHLVADLKFSLLTNAKIARQVNREEVEYIIQNQLDGQVFRVSAFTYPLLAKMNGTLTVNDIWHQSLASMGENVPTQQELMQLLSSLYKAGLVRTSEFPNIEAQKKAQTDKKFQQLMAKLKFPLAIKLPLFDPNPFLNRTSKLTQYLFHPLTIFCYVSLLCLGLLQFAIHFDSFGKVTADSLFALENMIIMALIYPVVKAIHEFGHAYCVKHWGGEVHEMGIMFLVFFPVPYVDASASACFENKYARMLVGAAGILVELGITALAILVWVAAEPSLIKAVAYNVIILCGISTLVFNGNPLLRFDAYYVLADWWEEPNLGKIANAQTGYLIKKYILRIQDASGLPRTIWQNTRLVLYAIASYLYRLSVMILIAIYIATGYFILGVAVACMSIYFGFIKPTWKFLMAPKDDQELKQYPHRTKFAYGALILFLSLFLFVIPMPQTLTVEGVVIPQEGAYVRAPANGIIAYFKKTAEQVNKDDLLIELQPDSLFDLMLRMEQQLRSAQQQIQLKVLDPIAHKKAVQNAQWLTERIDLLKTQVADSNMTAPHSGDWVPEAQLRLGTFVGQGTTLGYLLEPGNMKITTLVPEEEVEFITDAPVNIRRIINQSSYQTKIITVANTGSRVVNYPRLTVTGGGKIATQSDQDQREIAVRPWVTYELAIPFNEITIHERVQIKFELADEPLIYRWYRGIRRSFLNWFGI